MNSRNLLLLLGLGLVAYAAYGLWRSSAQAQGSSAGATDASAAQNAADAAAGFGN